MFFAFVAPPPFGIFQLDLIPALILTVIFVGLIGTFLYRLAIHPVVENLVSVLVITVAAIFIFQHVIMLQFGTKGWPVPSFIGGYAIILDVKLKYSRILAFVVSLVLFAFTWIFVKKTKIGTAMRAISQDREVAMLMGINTETRFSTTG